MKKKVLSVLLIFVALLFGFSSVCFADDVYSFKKIRLLYPEVRTERLLLTLETKKDVDILAEYLLDKDVTRYLDDDLEEGFDDLEEAKNYLMSGGNFYDPNNLTYTVKLADGTPIGELEFMYHRGKKQVTVAYWLGKPYWGQKYISEVSLIMSNVVINALDVDEICVLYFYENKSSARISDKIFQYLIEQNKTIEFDEYKEDYPDIHTEGHVLHKFFLDDLYLSDVEVDTSEDTSEDTDESVSIEDNTSDDTSEDSDY